VHLLESVRMVNHAPLGIICSPIAFSPFGPPQSFNNYGFLFRVSSQTLRLSFPRHFFRVELRQKKTPKRKEPCRVPLGHVGRQSSLGVACRIFPEGACSDLVPAEEGNRLFIAVVLLHTSRA
jgi:hypothetical protein